MIGIVTTDMVNHCIGLYGGNLVAVPIDDGQYNKADQSESITCMVRQLTRQSEHYGPVSKENAADVSGVSGSGGH